MNDIERAYTTHARDVYRYLLSLTHDEDLAEELTEELPGGETPERSVLLHMEKTALYRAIHALPEPMREVVHMRLTGEFTFAEIGGILGKSENWARITFYRAKKKVIEEMEEWK